MGKGKNNQKILNKNLNEISNYLQKIKTPDKAKVLNLLKQIKFIHPDSIRHQESLNQTILYSIGDAVITTNIKCKIQRMNPVAEKLCGWKESEATGKPLDSVFNIISQITGKKIKNSAKKVLISGRTMSFANDTLLVSKSGKRIPIADSCAPIKNESDKIIGVVIVFRDQTAEREKQNEFEDRQRKFSTLVSNLPGFVYRCANDMNWSMEFISEGCKKITGYSPSDFINNKKIKFNDIIHPDYQKPIWKSWQKILKAKTFIESEYPIITKSGKIKWVWERGRGVYSKDGKVLFLEGFIEDIDEKRNIEKSLKIKNIVFESSITANSIADLDGKIVDANAYFLKFWKYSNKASVLGKSLSIFIKKKKDVESILASLNKNGKWEGKFIAIRSDKSEFIAYGLATTIVDENGRKIGYQSSVQDITDRIKIEEMLLESENRYKSLFDNSPDAIFLADPDTGKIIDANKAALSLIKLPHSKVIGMHQSQLHPNRFESYSLKTFKRHKKAGGLKIPVENIVVTSTGEEVPVEVLASKLKISGKNVMQGVFRNISERKKIEKALQESESKFQLFFEQSKDAMLLLDDKVFFDCNKAAVEMLGYAEKSELLPAHPAQLSPEFQPDGSNSLYRAKKIMRQAYKEGFIQFEWVHRKKNGENICVEVMLSLIPLSDKKILFTVWRDITERKRIENELQKSKDRMQILVEGTPHLFFYVQNLEGNIEYISPSVETITGYPVSKWLNQNHWFITDSPINENAKSRTFSHLKGEINTDPVYVEIFHSNGSKVLIEVYERPILKDNKVIGLHGVAHDITERLRFEQHLKNSENSYRGLFNSVSEAIYILDEQGIFIDINQGALRMYGYDRDELIGKTPEYVSAPNKNNLQAVVKSLGIAFNGQKQQFEFWGRRKNGDEFLKDVRLYPGTYFNKKVIIAIATDITEKRKIENALSLSEQRYRAISNLTSDYLFSTEADQNGAHKLVWIAGSFEKITGYTFEEYQKIGGWRATLHPDELELDDLDLKKLQRNQKVTREIKTYHKSGSLVWVRSSAQPIWDNINDKLIGVYGSVEDITQRKQTEIIQRVQYRIADAAVTYKTLTELFENIREELSAIINVNNFFIALYDEKTGMLRSDVDKDEIEEIASWPAKNSMTGYVIEQGKSVLLRRSEINKLIETGEAGMIGVIPEIWLGVPFKIGGKIFGVLVVQSYNNINAYDKKSIEILEVVAHEISLFMKHKNAEEEALKLSTAVIQSPSIVVITDPNGNIEYANPKFCEVTGYTFEEAKGKNQRILNSGYHHKEFFANLWNTILSGKIWQGEIHNKKKNGDLYWENVLISPLVDSEGNVSHFVAVKEDITEKKKMIEELIVAKEKAEEMNRIKSSFFANMSHELRTPMVGILGFSELLMNEVKDNPEYFRMINSINTSGQRLLETLNLILSLSKLESGNIEANLNTVNIVPILNECYHSFSSVAAKKRLVYQLNCDQNEIQCNIDTLLFQSIINNLLNNAIKFTDHGSIIIDVNTHEESVKIKVADSGLGISEEKLELIWEEFRQVSEGYNRSFEGTGLGLTIARKYTQLMNGTINVISKIGFGTTFTLIFPTVLSKLTKEKTIPQKTEDTILPAIPTINLPIVLYVEDDEIAFRLVSTITKGFYIIELAKDSDEALQKINTTIYDAILMDINFHKGMDGIELTRVIRKISNYKTTPIIALTAFAMGREQEEFLTKGMTHYLSKPFVKKQLFDVLESAIKTKM